MRQRRGRTERVEVIAMNPRADFCPGCGAQVYPEEANCPFCGRKLHASFFMPFMVGLGGTVVALVAGGLVWWVMQAPPSAPSAAAPAGEVAANAVPAASPAAPPAAAPPADVPPAAPQAAPPAAPQAAPPPADVKEAALPLPTVRTPVQAPPADAQTRRAYAKSKQESFVQNGLDLQVTTSGEEATTLIIKFSFPAKDATEQIVSGPFPRQCEQRGFKQVVFMDPSGISWVYDVATQKLTQK